jgi:uncharacterized protein YodC (DUF2158 family)
MNSFKKGDIVKLKSGSPPMTVAFISEENVKCIYFLNGSFLSETLAAHLLIEVEKQTE